MRRRTEEPSSASIFEISYALISNKGVLDTLLILDDFGTATHARLAEQFAEEDLPVESISEHLQKLTKVGVVTGEDNNFSLTKKGKDIARRINELISQDLSDEPASK